MINLKKSELDETLSMLKRLMKQTKMVEKLYQQHLKQIKEVKK